MAALAMSASRGGHPQGCPYSVVGIFHVNAALTEPRAIARVFDIARIPAMNKLHYKGYTATIDFDAEGKVFFGRVDGINDIVSFHADTVADLEKEFADTMEFYFAGCAEDGRAPDKPDSDKLTLLLPARVRAAASAAADASGQSLNRWATAAIAQAAGVAL